MYPHQPATFIFADYSDLMAVQRRIKELLSRIPRGTICTADNNCGGFLTAAEDAELNRLLATVEGFDFLDEAASKDSPAL